MTWTPPHKGARGRRRRRRSKQPQHSFSRPYSQHRAMLDRASFGSRSRNTGVTQQNTSNSVRIFRFSPFRTKLNYAVLYSVLYSVLYYTSIANPDGIKKYLSHFGHDLLSYLLSGDGNKFVMYYLRGLHDVIVLCCEMRF